MCKFLIFATYKFLCFNVLEVMVMNDNINELPVYFLYYFQRLMADMWLTMKSKDALLNMIIISRKLSNNAFN